jgi:hypothetical protein
VISGALTGAAVYLLAYFVTHLMFPGVSSLLGFWTFSPVPLVALPMVVGSGKGAAVGALAFTGRPWLVRAASVGLFASTAVFRVVASVGGEGELRGLNAINALVLLAGSLACAEIVLRFRGDVRANQRVVQHGRRNPVSRAVRR